MVWLYNAGRRVGSRAIATSSVDGSPPPAIVPISTTMSSGPMSVARVMLKATVTEPGVEQGGVVGSGVSDADAELLLADTVDDTDDAEVAEEVKLETDASLEVDECDADSTDDWDA
jgi:hypothetical protein